MVRWWPWRKWEHYISIKLDLKRKSERNIESTEFNLILSKLIKPQILEFNPLAKVKILDTSPWVPRKAEFEIEITTPYKKDKEELIRFNTYLYEKIKKDLNESLVKDHYTDVENYQNKYEIKLNHELITRSGLSSTQVWNTLTMIFSWAEISEVNDLRYKSANNIFVSVLKEQKNTEEVFNRITFTNNRWKKVYLKDISELIIKENKQDFNNYDRKPVSYIVWETTYDSIAQVVEKIKWKTDSNKFWAWKYKVVSKDNMNTTIIDTKLWTEFNLKYNWDWKTMKETVWELRSAIVLAFIAIFIFMVIKFKSFAVGWVIMTTFIFWFIGIIPWFAMLYLINGTLFSSIWNLW
jgi:multidrug efflux pump subunit AcrB